MPLPSGHNFRVTRDVRGVVTISLDVPGRAVNVLNEPVISELASLIENLEHDPAVRLVLIRSDKESGFIAGADLRALAAFRSPREVDRFLVAGEQLFDRLEGLAVPTVAVIHGACLGGGLEFALACRYRFALDDASTRLGFPEVELGLLPGWDGTQRLPERVGLAAALPLLLEGRPVSPRQAADMGLVDGAWPPERFADAVEQFVADRLQGKPFRRRQSGLLAQLRDRTRVGQWLQLRAVRCQVARNSSRVLGAARGFRGHRARALRGTQSEPEVDPRGFCRGPLPARMPSAPGTVFPAQDRTLSVSCHTNAMNIMNRQSFLIAGGSSGLGAACVRRLAGGGSHGVVADLRPPEEALLNETAGRWVFCQADVTEEASIRAALATAQERFGPVRGVVVCAGILHAERILGRAGVSDLNAFRQVIEVNLVGTFNVLRLAASAMQGNDPDGEGQRGVIVLTASTAAFEGQVGQAAYSASKGGVASLTLPAARELGRFGIRVVCIAPGVFETPMMQPVPAEQRQSLQAQISFPQRFGRPDEYAALVEHILANPMLNGAILRLDGGLRMPIR